MSDPQGKKGKGSRKKKEQKEETSKDGLLSNVSRRTMLKMSAAAGAATVLTSRKASAFTGPTPPAEPVLCGTTAPASPPTTPFVDDLPIPFPAIPTILFPRPTKAANIGGGEAPRADHQRWNQFLPDVEYFLEARPSTHKFHSDLLPSYFWGFNGRYPAPTVLNAYGHPTLVRFRNSLPDPTTSFGIPQMTIHLHNGHTGSESDGFAQDFFGTGLFKDNHYVNAYAGIDDFGGIGDPREAMHTFWFHDHRAAFTANNNYLGLNGFYLVYDKTDPGHEFNTSGSLRLPGFYGITDIPLLLTDKRFCPAANGRNEMFQVVGAGAPGGDKWVVNGAIQPKFQVRRRKYRFRILNTGPVKTWNLRFVKSDGTQLPMTVVAADANFLHEPWEISSGDLTIFVASRYDVVVDFSGIAVGEKVYIREATVQNVGVATPDPAPGLPIGNVLMRLDVVGGIFLPDTPEIPDTLVDLPPVPTPDAFFEYRFTLESGQFLINGLPFDPNVPIHCVLKGSTEEWHLRNDVLPGNWVHPVHIHFEEGRIMERTQRINVGTPDEQTIVLPLNPDEHFNNARRDVYPLPGQNSVRMRQQFRDFIGRYLIHCHNMNHEDDFMMVRWDIVETPEELCKVREEIIQRRREAGVDVAAGLPRNKDGEVLMS